MAPLADMLKDLPAIAGTQGRGVKNTGGVGMRRGIDERNGRQRQPKNEAGSQATRSGQI
jgi:hypothetical protein